MEVLNNSDEYFMKEALKEAQKAFEADEVPVGAIVVCANKIIARAHNLTERLTDVTAHAEMQAITSAANYLNGKYLNECTLYVTLEPCLMCSGAIAWAQLGKLVYGAFDTKRGFGTLATELKMQGVQNQGITKKIFHPKTQITGGLLETECAELMRRFFQRKRF